MKMKDEKVEVEEYCVKGELMWRLANGILIFISPEGYKLLENYHPPLETLQ